MRIICSCFASIHSVADLLPTRLHALASGAQPATTLRALDAPMAARPPPTRAGYKPAAVTPLLLVLLLLMPVAMGLYDHGPIKPRSTTPALDASETTWGATIAEGFPTWYRDDFGRVCEPCTAFDPSGAGSCLSTYVSPDPTHHPLRRHVDAHGRIALRVSSTGRVLMVHLRSMHSSRMNLVERKRHCSPS